MDGVCVCVCLRCLHGLVWYGLCVRVNVCVRASRVCGCAQYQTKDLLCVSKTKTSFELRNFERCK